MKTIGTFSVKCNKCGKQHDFMDDDIFFDIDSSEEREMGVENEHIWDENFECDICENEMEINYHVWEYPVGIFNLDDIKVSGAEIANNSLVFEFIDSVNDLDEDDLDEDDE